MKKTNRRGSLTGNPDSHRLIINGQEVTADFMRALHVMIVEGRYREFIEKGYTINDIWADYKAQHPDWRLENGKQTKDDEGNESDEDDSPDGWIS